MAVFVVKRYAVREAKRWRYAVRKAKIGRYAVHYLRKGGGSITLLARLAANCYVQIMSYPINEIGDRIVLCSLV